MLAQADTMNYICNRIFKTAKQNINNLKRYIMKKFTSILAMIMMAAMSLTFVSCDDDEYIADTLWGVWEGDMYVTSEWNGHTPTTLLTQSWPSTRILTSMLRAQATGLTITAMLRGTISQAT